jgi:broad specificity phosphatase PhoE
MSNSKFNKTVYFVRHGQSDGNVDPVFQSPDCALNENGRAQANLIAERAKNIQFDALISSPFRRARETAEAISAATGMSVEYSEFFKERVKPSSIDGKPYDDEQAKGVWRRWEESLITLGLKVEDGENFEDLFTRSGKALDYLLSRPEQVMVVVTHGYFLRTILSRVALRDHLSPEISGVFQQGFVTQNTGITVLRHHDAFEEESRWRVHTFNDQAHLG